MMPLTRIICPECKEEFFVLGHDMFGGAEAVPNANGMPPGFAIMRRGLVSY